MTDWRSLHFFVAGCAIACLCASGLARAQGARPDVDERGRELFEQAKSAYDAGDFEGALAQFRAAYELSKRPQLLYNIGLSADRLGHTAEALDAYRGYVAALPDAHNRVSVSDRIRALEATLEPVREEAPSEAPPEQAPAAEGAQPMVAESRERADEGESRSFPIAPVVVLGAGAAVVGVGVYFGVKAKQGEDDYAAAPVASAQEALAAQKQITDAENKANTANILFALGGAAVVAGAVWLTFELGLWDGSESTAQATAWIDRDVAGVHVRGTWGSASW